jgi:hypothetical protein
MAHTLFSGLMFVASIELAEISPGPRPRARLRVRQSLSAHGLSARPRQRRGRHPCHWHHARFDLASGCTFDLWVDDVPTCPIEVRDLEVWVKPCPCRKLKREHIRGVARPGLAAEARGLLSGRRAGSGRPSSTIGECEARCSIFDTN